MGEDQYHGYNVSKNKLSFLFLHRFVVTQYFFQVKVFKLISIQAKRKQERKEEGDKPKSRPELDIPKCH